MRIWLVSKGVMCLRSVRPHAVSSCLSVRMARLICDTFHTTIIFCTSRSESALAPAHPHCFSHDGPVERKDDTGHCVPGFPTAQIAVDFAAKIRLFQVTGDKDRMHGPPNFQQRLMHPAFPAIGPGTNIRVTSHTRVKIALKYTSGVRTYPAHRRCAPCSSASRICTSSRSA